MDAKLFINSETNPNTNIRYYSGFTGAGALIIFGNGKKLLVLSEMEAPKATVVKYVYKKDFYEELNQILRRHKVKTIGIDFNDISVNQFRRLRKFGMRIKDISKEVLFERQIKKPVEILKLKRSCDIASKILSKCINNFIFKTELEVRNFLFNEMKKYDVLPSFDPIVASGKNGSVPHYEGRGRLLKGFCIIDMGVKYDGYCSDITRTIFLGKPGKFEIETYNELLKIQGSVIEYIQDGILVKAAVEHVLTLMGEKKKYFIHSLGHGIGLDIHEAPWMSVKSKTKFSKGMAFAIEPGLYYQNKFGIRIEDSLFINNRGVGEVMTNVSKKLKIIPF